MRKGTASGGVLIALTGAVVIGGGIVGLSAHRQHESDFLFERYTLTPISDTMSSGGGTPTTQPGQTAPPGSTHSGSTNTHLASTDNHSVATVTHNAFSDSHQTTSVTHLPVTANHKTNSITHGTASGLHLANTDGMDPPGIPTVDRHKVDSMLHYLSTTWYQSPDNIHTSRTDTHHVGSDFHDYRSNTHKANTDNHDPQSNTHKVSTANHSSNSNTHLSTTTTHKPSTFYEVPGGPTEPWWIPWVSSVEELEQLIASGYFDNPPPDDDGEGGETGN